MKNKIKKIIIKIYVKIKKPLKGDNFIY